MSRAIWPPKDAQFRIIRQLNQVGGGYSVTFVDRKTYLRIARRCGFDPHVPSDTGFSTNQVRGDVVLDPGVLTVRDAGRVEKAAVTRRAQKIAREIAQQRADAVAAFAATASIDVEEIVYEAIMQFRKEWQE